MPEITNQMIRAVIEARGFRQKFDSHYLIRRLMQVHTREYADDLAATRGTDPIKCKRSANYIPP